MLFMRVCPPVWPDPHRSFHGSDFLEVGIHDTVIVGLLLVVGSTCVGAGLCACSLLCGSSCLVHLLEHLAQSFLLCLDTAVAACWWYEHHGREDETSSKEEQEKTKEV